MRHRTDWQAARQQDPCVAALCQPVSGPASCVELHVKALSLLTALLLAACGGSNSGSDAVVANPARGQLLQRPPELVSTVTAPALLLALNALANQQLLAISGTPLCDIAVHRIRYATVGGANEATTASGALMVPLGGDPHCRGARPILLYAHGTTTDRAFDMTNLQGDPNGEALIMAALFASQGYIVVAPDYAGYDSSTLPYHPYLVADQQSKDMIDALTAARSALPTAAAPATTDGGRLFITGYSQGGYVAMATHRAMQAAGMTVTASAPMSGPYAMAAFVDAVFSGRVSSGATVSATLLITAYQKSYGNIYSGTADVFEAQYAGGIESLLPSTTPRSVLYAQGKLPQGCAVQRDASGSGVCRHHARDHAGQSGADLRGRLRHGPPGHEQLPPELTSWTRRPIRTAAGQRRRPALRPRRPGFACGRR